MIIWLLNIIVMITRGYSVLFAIICLTGVLAVLIYFPFMMVFEIRHDRRIGPRKDGSGPWTR